MPSFLQYIEKNGKLPVCLTMSLAAYIAFYSNDIQELNDKGLAIPLESFGSSATA